MWLWGEGARVRWVKVYVLVELYMGLGGSCSWVGRGDGGPWAPHVHVAACWLRFCMWLVLGGSRYGVRSRTVLTVLYKVLPHLL